MITKRKRLTNENSVNSLPDGLSSFLAAFWLMRTASEGTSVSFSPDDPMYRHSILPIVDRMLPSKVRRDGLGTQDRTRLPERDQKVVRRDPHDRLDGGRLP